MKLHIFFEEVNALLLKFPHVPATIVGSENSDYGDKIYQSKNLSFCFDCASSSDCIYTYDSYMSANLLDCDYCSECELTYESVDGHKCFNTTYVEYCGNIRDSDYVYDSMNCHDVFGCVHLQNKSFCIFNRQFSESEYREKVAIYKSWPAEKVLAIVEELKQRYPVTQTIEMHNENSSYGNYVHFSKNCYLSFDAAHNEDCAYIYDSFYNKGCYDATYASQNNQVSYELVDSGEDFNCAYMVNSNGCHDSSYLFNCTNVKDCLGCVSLSNKQYCVLNRQLSKEDYERVRADIFTQLQQQKLDWGTIRFTS